LRILYTFISRLFFDSYIVNRFFWIVSNIMSNKSIWNILVIWFDLELLCWSSTETRAVFSISSVFSTTKNRSIFSALLIREDLFRKFSVREFVLNFDITLFWLIFFVLQINRYRKCDWYSWLTILWYTIVSSATIVIITA